MRVCVLVIDLAAVLTAVPGVVSALPMGAAGVVLVKRVSRK